MSYTIHYGPDEPTRHEHKNRWLGIVGAVVILTVCLLAISWYMPQQVRLLREAFFPWTRSDVQSAFLEFRENARHGQPIGEAFTVFCRDMIHGIQ